MAVMVAEGTALSLSDSLCVRRDADVGEYPKGSACWERVSRLRLDKHGLWPIAQFVAGRVIGTGRVSRSTYSSKKRALSNFFTTVIFCSAAPAGCDE